ncbi:MAG TPA: GIY-YIG nuclease family protein [bacterium]|nr:GIY-YIG nuclease family protein [bacterium]
MSWWVYVLVSRGGRRTYVGVSTDTERRLAQHNGSVAGGAKSTRAGRPWKVGALYGPYPDRGAAQSAEQAVRRYRGRARLGLTRPERAAPPPPAPTSR